MHTSPATQSKVLTNVQHIYMYMIEKKIYSEEIQNLNRKRERPIARQRDWESRKESLSFAV